MYTELKLMIAGAELSGGGRREEAVIDPSNEEVLGLLPHASADDLDRALEVAQQAFGVWRVMPAIDRAKILRKASELIRERADRIAAVQTLEQGKAFSESRLEVLLSCDTLEWLADEGRRAYGRVIPGHVPNARVYTMQEPVGPVAAFSPWNFPALTAMRKMAGALAAGCSIILKPSEETPGTALELARAFYDAGLPPGTLQIVFGEPAKISEHLLASKIIRKISFTGSTAVGAHLAGLAARSHKRYTMELGGHAPVIVAADADIEKAAQMLTAAKFRNAGQICVAPSRFFVQDAVYDEFVGRAAKLAAAIPVGPGMDEKTVMGPLANMRRLEAVRRLVTDATRVGAKIATGGERIGNKGFFFQPTVLSEISDEARIMTEETFGPIMPVTRFKDMDEAVERANSLDVGLAAFLFTSSERTARIVPDALEVGMVSINTTVVTLPQSPFGGIKASGEGHEGGIEGLEAYTVKKLVTHQ